MVSADVRKLQEEVVFDNAKYIGQAGVSTPRLPRVYTGFFSQQGVFPHQLHVQALWLSRRFHAAVTVRCLAARQLNERATCSFAKEECNKSAAEHAPRQSSPGSLARTGGLTNGCDMSRVLPGNSNPPESAPVKADLGRLGPRWSRSHCCRGNVEHFQVFDRMNDHLGLSTAGVCLARRTSVMKWGGPEPAKQEGPLRCCEGDGATFITPATGKPCTGELLQHPHHTCTVTGVNNSGDQTEHRHLVATDKHRTEMQGRMATQRPSSLLQLCTVRAKPGHSSDPKANTTQSLSPAISGGRCRSRLSSSYGPQLMELITPMVPHFTRYQDGMGIVGRSSSVSICCCLQWLKGKPQHPDSLLCMVTVVMTRLQLPWPSLGAWRVDLSVIPPLVLLPVVLRVAAMHLVLGVVVLAALPGLILWYYYATHRRRGRTRFFLSLALSSLAYLYWLFLTEVLPRGDVSPVQLGTVTAGLALTLACLARTKREPGYVRPHLADAHSTITYHGKPPDGDSAHPKGSCRQVVIANGARGAEQTGVAPRDGGKREWCPTCRLVRPPRAGHCRICGTCVQRLDHHCVCRINSCVGQANHRCFLLTLLLFLVTSLYGISLVLRSVCPRQNLLLALLYCPGVYAQYRYSPTQVHAHTGNTLTQVHTQYRYLSTQVTHLHRCTLSNTFTQVQAHIGMHPHRWTVNTGDTPTQVPHSHRYMPNTGNTPAQIHTNYKYTPSKGNTATQHGTLLYLCVPRHCALPVRGTAAW
ncbi:hypothetical protein JZ751_013980 [Albula glossodonta]|uniref:Palmitoyltransferase n=1 Tax=Albula glossodonta TaxID=121402 RepID=A0A8T2N3B9_9TELE|nr:hypothetical protein JZ751_013980 [Albula glossodonta]